MDGSGQANANHCNQANEAANDEFAFESEPTDIEIKVVLPDGTIIDFNLSIPPAGLVRDEKHRILKQYGYPEETFDKYEMIIDHSREGEIKMIDGEHMKDYAKYLSDNYVKFRVVSSEVRQPQEGIPTDMNYQLIQPQE